MRNKWITCLLAAGFAAMQPTAFAEEAPKIVKQFRAPTAPSPEVAGKRIYLQFVDSQKLTKLLNERLKDAGYDVAASPETAEVKFELRGQFVLSGAGKDRITGSLGPMMEDAIKVNPSEKPDYTHQTVNVTQIAAVKFGTGSFSITDIALWISQTVGIAGAVNTALTGDPRGICIAGACNSYTSRVFIAAKGAEGFWHVDSAVASERVLLDVVIADAIERIVAPLVELKSGAKKDSRS